MNHKNNAKFEYVHDECELIPRYDSYHQSPLTRQITRYNKILLTIQNIMDNGLEDIDKDIYYFISPRGMITAAVLRALE